MEYLWYIILELFGLYLISRKLTNQLYHIFFAVFHTRSLALPFLIALLFPGTIIHELSHLFTAEILGVKTGKLTLVPESIKEERVQMGSVELTRTDPFRRSIIGLAPFLTGLTALFILSTLLPDFWNKAILAYQQNRLLSSPYSYFVLLTSYFLFCISATMFASREDMKGVIPLGIVLGILGIGIYFAGIRIGLTMELEKTIEGFLSAIAKSLSAVIFLNLCLYFISSICIRAIPRVKTHG